MASSVGIGLRESVGNLANGVGIRVSLTLAIVTSVATIDTFITSITSITTVTNSSITSYTTMSIINSGDNSDIMRMASSVSIGLRESVGNLAEGVGIRVGLTLAIEAMMVATIDTSIASIATVSDSSITSYMTMSIVNSGDNSDIVRMASSVGIGLRESVSNLANGVGIRVSLTLAIVTSVATIDTSITSITSIATVSDSSITGYTTISIINSGDNSDIMRMASSVGIGLRESIGNLAEGVGIRVSFTLAIVTSVATIDTSITSI